MWDEDTRPHRGIPRMGEDRRFVKFSTSLPPDIYERLQRYCDDEEREKSWVLKKAADAWLKEKGY